MIIHGYIQTNNGNLFDSIGLSLVVHPGVLTEGDVEDFPHVACHLSYLAQ